MQDVIGKYMAKGCFDAQRKKNLGRDQHFLFAVLSEMELAMFAFCQSQKSLRKHEDPIIGNSFIPFPSAA